ncbi:MAG: hypothetical protein U9R55_08265 [Pseudomonadota bacterium]|nr:hypothetical protein [Pseudomonadota bacterium]
MSTSALEEWPALAAAKVSFRSSTANAWAASFVRHLGSELAKENVPAVHRRLSEVCQAAQALFEAHHPAWPDTASSTVLGMCALMLSARRQLAADMGDPAQALELVRRSFDHAYQAFIQNICKPLLHSDNRSRQALAGMNFRAWSERMYPRKAPQAGLSREDDITGYHHFLLAQGEPALAHIILRADQAWIAAVAAHGPSPLGESRRTRASDTPTDGADGFAPFRFVPKRRGQTSQQQDVILELQLHAVPGDRRSDAPGADRRRHWSGVDRRQAGRRQDDERARQ